MTHPKIAQQRLYNQGLVKSKFKTPADVVRLLGAVQAQDYPGAKYSIALRIPNASEEDIEKAISEGKIIRTHVLRPTWHFVAPEDVRWMLALTGPRIKSNMQSYYNKLGLNKETLSKSRNIIIKSLKGKCLSRLELKSLLEKKGIPTKEMKFGFILLDLELDAIICNGPHKGKQFTYVLLEEYVPKVRPITKEESLARLTKTYFTSHGPATISDFTWWSGLTIKDAKKGLDLAKPKSMQIENKTYWFFNDKFEEENSSFFLPTYDEYLISYKDRSAAIDAAHSKIISAGNGFYNTIVIGSKVVGTWRRTIKKNTFQIETRLFRKLTSQESFSMHNASRHYASFFGMSVKMI